jgi:predicted dehydrogenase
VQKAGPFLNQDLRVGIVGFGGAAMAQVRHFQALGCPVVAVYDPKPGGIARANAVVPPVLATSDFAKFLSSGINTVSVCSPDSTHADYVVAALDAGFHVVCEKPLTDSVDGYRRILEAEDRAKGTGVIAAVQHQMRFLPVHLEMKKLIRSGELGRISYIEGYYVHNLTKRAWIHDDWRRTDNATPLVYSGCHFVDLLRWLLDDEVEEVSGMANNIAFPEYPESDLNVVLLRFKSGVVAKVIVAFGAGRPQDHSVRVYGSEKSIENNLLFAKDGSYRVFARPPAPGLAVESHSLRGYRAMARANLDYLIVRSLEGLMRYKKPHPEFGILSYPIRLYPHNYAVRSSLRNFVNAIQGVQHLECSLVDAARTVATCLAGVEAYRTGKTIKVKDYWLPELDPSFSAHSIQDQVPT